MNNTGLVILAAGASSRLNGIKQLLPFRGKTLLQHVMDEGLASGARPVIVVTGAHAEAIQKNIPAGEAEFYHNDNWTTGMASGIVAGLKKAMLLNAKLTKLIIAVCDQPFVSAGLFKQLDECQQKNEAGIVASTYAGTVGVPVLFTEKYFDALLQLRGDEGAKKILRVNPDAVVMVDFPAGAMDIDTPRDYDDLLLQT